MRMLSPASASAIVEALTSIRDPAAGSMLWTLQFIARADEQFHGAWSDVELDAAEALAILLPPHAGEPCKGDRLPLVGAGGARVDDVASAFRAIERDYASSNASCWSRITAAAREPFSTIILTAAPLHVEEFQSVVHTPGALYRLDGFHRLIGWAWAGRLTPNVKLRALVAG